MVYSVNILLLVVSLFSCHSDLTLPKGSLSDLKIAGGEEVDQEDYPAILELETLGLAQQSQSCSAVMIRPRVMLTAAHCLWLQSGSQSGTSFQDPFDADVEDQMNRRRHRPDPFADDRREGELTPGVEKVQLRMESLSPRRREELVSKVTQTGCYLLPKGYGLESGGPGTRFDIGLVFWPEELVGGEDPRSFLPLAKQPYALPSGTSIEIIGYGWNAEPFKDSHRLRRGTNRLPQDKLPQHREELGVILTLADPTEPSNDLDRQMVRDGDSGGPMLYQGEVLGIASALLRGTQRKICSPGVTEGQEPCELKTVDVGYHVDVTYEKTAKFIAEALGKFESGSINPKTLEGCMPRSRKDFLTWLKVNPELH